MKFDSHELSTSFHHCFVSLSFSHDFKNPQMIHRKLQMCPKIENFRTEDISNLKKKDEKNIF